MMLPIVRQAADAVGGPTKLSALISAPRESLYLWAKWVPAEYVLPMERATGISRSKIRPDLYPLEESAPKRKTGGVA